MQERGYKDKLLIVDDIELNRKALCDVLGQSYMITEASSGMEALDILEKDTSYSIVILDLLMPKMDGFELLQIIKSNTRFADIAVIISSVHGEENNEIKALKLGADDIIFKPYNADIILHRVHKAISQKRLIKQLNTSKCELDNIIANIPGGIGKIVLSENKIIPVFISDGWCAMMEDTRENILRLYANNAMAGVHPDDYDRVWNVFTTAMQTGQPINSVYRVRNTKNEYRWVNNRSSLVSDENGMASYYAVYTDVTEEIEAKQKYEKAAKDIELIYNGIPGAVFKCRFDAGWTIVFANDGLFRFLGYSRDEFKELFGNKMSGVIYPEDGAVMTDKISKQLEHATSVVNENRLICKDGSIKWISIHAEFMEDENRDKYFYCTFVDITEQKRAEAALSNTQEKLTAAIDHAGVAYWEYDIRNNKAYSNSVFTSEYGPVDILDNYPQSVYDSGIIHMDSVAEYQRLIDAIRKGEKTAVADIKTIDENGEIVWKRIRFTALFDEYKKPFWAIATAESIDEYKRLEQQFSLAASQTGIEVWTYDFANSMIIRTAQTGIDYGVSNVIENVPECLVSLGVVHPDDAKPLYEMHRKMCNGEPKVSCELRMFRADLNAYSYHKIDYTVIFDKNGKPEKAIGTGIDISEKILLKKKYKEAVEYYHNSIGENILITGHCNITQNRILEIVSVNDTDYVAAFGEDREQFFQKFSSHIIDTEKQQEFLDKFLNVPLLDAYKNGITTQKIKCLIEIEEGDLVYVTITVDVMKEPDTNELTGFFSVVNITPETIYKKAINSVVDNFYDFIVDVDVKKDIYFMLSSKKGLTNTPAATGVFSKTNEEYARNCLDEQSTKECIEKLSYQYILEKLEEIDSYSFNYRICENDEIRTKKIQVFYIDKATQHIGFTRVDVTNLLQQEQQKNEALAHALTSSERASKAKTDFLSRMSHDIRTPMNAIIGMTELTKSELNDKVRIKENLQVIDTSAKLLLRMINDLLDMSKIESGSMTLVKETFDCVMECQKVVEMAQVMFEQKQQKFEVIKEIHHRYFVGDIIRLKRVIINLLNNAAKFTPRGGVVQLTVTEKKTTNSKISLLTFIISDNGIGIPEEKIATIFEPFTRLDSDAKYEGTGLGLPIVKSIVEAKGGTMSVESEVGKGSVFTVSIPMGIDENNYVAVSEEANDKVVSNIDFTGLRILLVEDHPVNILVAKRLLERCGALVDTAENGMVGYEKFTKSKNQYYNVIFMDIQMPVMNGYEAARAIRKSAHPQAKTIMIIAMTANAYAEDIQKSMDNGMNEHIAKPISIEMIARAINSTTGCISNKKENQNHDK